MHHRVVDGADLLRPLVLAGMRRMLALLDEVTRIVSGLASIRQRHGRVVANGVEVLLSSDSVAVAAELRAVGFDLQVQAGRVNPRPNPGYASRGSAGS